MSQVIQVTGKPGQTNQDIRSELEALRQQLAAAKAENQVLRESKSTRELIFKISEKGGLSVYGLGRFPLTLYKSQWLRLIAAVDAIKAFIIANADQLKEKQ